MIMKLPEQSSFVAKLKILRPKRWSEKLNVSAAQLELAASRLGQFRAPVAIAVQKAGCFKAMRQRTLERSRIPID
jgi:hypothetical protein